jgi:sigma-B regulation protein RsbU (phosphoserine phosphatase)
MEGRMLARRQIVDLNDPVAPPSVPARPAWRGPHLADLQADSLTVAPTDTNQRVMDLFEAHPDVPSIALVADGLPGGLINRNAFFAEFARLYVRDLFMQRECRVFAQGAPLVLEARLPLSEAGASIAQGGEKALAEGCIVVEDGVFTGLCRGATLVRALSDLQGEQHRRLLSSIDYASLIQAALLADSRDALKAAFPDRHELVWQPRDGVGGDCFFACCGPDGVLVGVMDCTGHGVPGALLTSIAVSEAGRLAADRRFRQHPAAMLSQLSRRMRKALRQDRGQSEGVGAGGHLVADDGMDAVFIWCGADDAHISIASARLPVFLIDEAGATSTLRGDRRGLGYRDTPAGFEWTEYKISKDRLTRIIMMTDGVCDQIGGEKQLAFGWSGIPGAITGPGDASLNDQVGAIWSAFKGHEGGQTRRDDLTILGLAF